MSKNILKIQKNNLEQAISSLANAYNKKDTFDLSSSILLETKDNVLYMKATNNEAISMKIKVLPESIEGRIFCAVKGELLSDCIKQGLEDSEVIIEFDDKKDFLHIKQKNYNAKTPVYRIKEPNGNNKETDEDLNDFPFKDDYKTTEGYKKIDIDNKLLIETFRNIIHCCDEKNFTRAFAQGIFLQIQNGKMKLVATDSLRLAFVEKDYENDKLDLSCIISKKGITELVKMFNDDFEFYIKEIDLQQANEEDEYEEIVAKIQNVCFVNENMEFYIKTINTTMPDISNALNKEKKSIHFSVKRESLLKGIQRINGLCSNARMTFNNDKIVIESLHGKSNSEVKDVIDDVNLELKESIEICISNKYIIECLANSKAENIDIYYEPNEPIFVDAKDFSEVIVLSQYD